MKLEQMKIKELLDTSHTIAEKLFEGHEYPWEVLGDINGFIESLGASLPENEYKKIGKNIWIHKTAQMAPTTAMGGPMTVSYTHLDVYKRQSQRQSCFRETP